MINRIEEQTEKGNKRLTIESWSDSRVNARAVIQSDNSAQKHMWLSVPTDYNIILSIEDAERLHEVLGAMLVAVK